MRTVGTKTHKDKLMNSLAKRSDCNQKEESIKKDLAHLQINPNRGEGEQRAEVGAVQITSNLTWKKRGWGRAAVNMFK